MNRFFQVLVGLCLLSAVLSLNSRSWAAAAGQIQQTSMKSYPGVVRANCEAQLAFRVGGPLVAVNVRPGDRVKQGQLLMQIDQRDFRDNISVLEAQLEGARANRQRTEKDFERISTLFRQEVAADMDFDNAKSAFEAAVAGVHTLEAQLRIARHRLQDTSLPAPFSGVITEQKIELYEMVQPGQVVLGIQDISELEVEIRVPEDDMIRRPPTTGETVAVEFSTSPGQSFSASLKEWQPVADSVTGTYLLRFVFAVPEALQVLPGMTAEIRREAN